MSELLEDIFFDMWSQIDDQLDLSDNHGDPEETEIEETFKFSKSEWRKLHNVLGEKIKGFRIDEDD